ncbi:DnaJ domain-containing protein [Sphingomonas gellani]|uniref:DnaJ domain-containing protein n=1 Tax=Sphingomonas gellani TaxID=1166340 RepID=A0A1H8JJK0_9SPHN|nr:DnaJ domain-containing protein [Sphingomonas gellani]SEN80963.1 DnaJ domain-containing protein [Sphingomonas gellani]
MKFLLALVVIWAAWHFLGRSRAKVRPAIADEVEARQVLGIDRDADADDIRAAHRRLVAQVHPDRGGSAELTRRVNAARDLLLRRLG